MNMKELGFYLYMESEEEKQQELEEENRKVNVRSNYYLVEQQAANREKEEDL